MKKRILCVVLCLAMCVGMAASFAGCKKTDKKNDAFVIMTEQLDGLFNPFYFTSANDGTIVGMTQIGMLGSTFKDGSVQVAYGANEAVVTEDYDITTEGDNTVYRFVLKNGIKFSDGHPLTMEDVLFNYYVYLDPVYTGSNTLYSTKILGLNEYRTQEFSSTTDNSNELLNNQASARAEQRVMELLNIYLSKKNSTVGDVTVADMEEAIRAAGVTSGYQEAISANPSEVTVDNLLNDYKEVLTRYKEELEQIYVSAQESFHDAPYKDHKEFENEIFCFLFMNGQIEVKYPIGADGKEDHTKFESLTNTHTNLDTKEKAIEYVFNNDIQSAFDAVLLYSATGGELMTEYTAKAKEVILQEKVSGEDGLKIKNISGIVSLGHSDKAGTTMKINGKDYKIASDHNADGTVKNADERDVLEITISGVDPKAIWNFAITIAPQHYYGEGSKVPVNIANDQFGVEFGSFEFMSKIIQSPRNVRLPMGAGAYKVTDVNNSDKPTESNFYKDNTVYFKANNYFETVGSGLHNAYIEKVRYTVVSSNNAIGALQSGSVHYISPSLTEKNYKDLEAMKKDGYVTLTTDQLGYGYIGVNAAKINDINLRKAIMCAMDTGLALNYYRAGTAEQIFWNMSTVSWAYPKNGSQLDNDNGKEYPPLNGKFDEQAAIDNIKKYMELAQVSAGDSKLEITFTIAGATADHPTYAVFRDAADLLNSLGWKITVTPDSQALTKISTGSLEVWAAAWSSALDPDMYQVYHKDSSATSTLAWGYNYIKTSGSPEEINTLNELSELIDQARETNDQNVRKELYKEAMGYVLDLAVELPVYQRDVLYAYNANVIDSSTVPSDVNPYSSPLDRIWELKFAG